MSIGSPVGDGDSANSPSHLWPAPDSHATPPAPAAPQPPPGAAAVPAPERPRRWYLWLVVPLVFAMGAGCGATSVLAFESISKRFRGHDKPLGQPGDLGLPRDPSDPIFGRVGDCVKYVSDDPDDYAMVLTPCDDVDAFKIVGRYNETADHRNCDTEWYHVQAEGTILDYILCFEPV